MQIIDQSIFTKEALTIPPDTTQEGWREIHKTILTCRKAATKWLSQSRAWAADQWGLDYVAEAEVQLEMALGLPQPQDKPSINPNDKSKALVSIEGIHQRFSMWQRKMQDDIPSWQPAQIKRALELLEPIEAQVRALRAMLP